MSINEDIQSPNTGELIELFKIDATSLGGDIYRLTPSKEVSNISIVFDQQEYFPVPIEATGFQYNSKGSLPRPTLRISSVSSLLSIAVIEFDDLLGSIFYRIRTFKKYLDNQPEADPQAVFPVDVYRFERKVNQNPIFIEWELSSYLDNEGIKIPKRQFLKDVCNHSYRFWNYTTNNFSYQNVTCPYVGEKSFDSKDSPCLPQDDSCSKFLSGCRKRFGENGILPTRAFPGVARI